MTASVDERATTTPQARRAIRLNIAFQTFFTLLLWTPIFYEYQRQLGMSPTEILGIQSIYYVAFCLLEIPTGMAADRIGYRRCMLGGAAVLVLANLLVVGLPTYWGFLLHFLLIALARSFVSGASSAYLYEYLHRTGNGPAYKQAEGSARAYSLVVRVLCWPAVGLLMQWQLSSPYWLTAISAAVAVLIALRLPAIPAEVSKATEAVPESVPLRIALRRALELLRRSPMLWLLMVQGVAIFTLARICQVNLFQPILNDKEIPLVSHGLVLSAMTVFEAVGSARPGLLRRYLSDLRAVFLLTVIMAVSLALTVPAGIGGTVAWLCVFALATGFSFPVQRQLINDAIPDSPYRATLLSIESIIDRSVCALVALALGGFLAAGQLNAFLIGSAAVSCLLMAVLAVLIPAVRRRQAAATPGQSG